MAEQTQTPEQATAMASQLAEQQATLKNIQDTQTRIPFEKGNVTLNSRKAALQSSIEQMVERQKAFAGEDDNKISSRLIRGGLNATAKDREFLSGVKKGETILGDEGLGRLGDDADVTGVLDRFKQQSETGMSSAESLAKKEQALKGIGQGTQTATRNLQASLGSSGVRGAAAGAQFAGIQNQGIQQRAQVEQNLFQGEEQFKRDAFKDFANAQGQVKTFDISQAAREKDIILSSGFGSSQIGSAERIAQFQGKASEAAAAAKSGGGK
jgi:hypothetical protein